MPLWQLPIMPNRPYPPEIEAGLDKALAAGPLRPLERRALGSFPYPGNRVIEYLCEGLSPYGLRVVAGDSEQYDTYRPLFVTRVF